jgi:hypothetical protein
MILQGHTRLKTREAIRKFGWTVLPHPPYSPHLTPSDFILFGALKDAIHGTKFETDDNVIHVVKTWLGEQNKAWYRQGIHTLTPHWRKAIEVDGDFVEK